MSAIKCSKCQVESSTLTTALCKEAFLLQQEGHRDRREAQMAAITASGSTTVPTLTL